MSDIGRAAHLLIEAQRFRMNIMEPIAYTFEADVHCPACTERRFGRGPNGFIAEEARDREGNEVGAVFAWDREHREPSADEGEWPGWCSECRQGPL